MPRKGSSGWTAAPKVGMARDDTMTTNLQDVRQKIGRAKEDEGSKVLYNIYRCSTCTI